MSKIDKLIIRLLSLPKDFTYDELVTILSSMGFIEVHRGKTGGSRRKFTHPNVRDKIIIHKPHGNNMVVDRVYLEQIIDLLSRNGFLGGWNEK